MFLHYQGWYQHKLLMLEIAEKVTHELVLYGHKTKCVVFAHTHKQTLIPKMLDQIFITIRRKTNVCACA